MDKFLFLNHSFSIIKNLIKINNKNLLQFFLVFHSFVFKGDFQRIFQPWLFINIALIFCFYSLNVFKLFILEIQCDVAFLNACFLPLIFSFVFFVGGKILIVIHFTIEIKILTALEFHVSFFIVNNQLLKKLLISLNLIFL